MKKSEDWYLSPTRQSAFAIMFIIYRVINALVRGFWPILVIVLFQSDRFSKSTIAIGAAVIGVVVVIASILHYLRFFFYLDGNQLHVEKGVLRRTRLDIPIDRIQSIALEQPLLHRLFNVLKVKIDTAGSAGEEFSFSALSVARAETLKRILQQEKKGSTATMEEDQPASQDKLVMQLSVRDLIKIGVSQNHIRTAGIILFFVLSLGEQVQDVVGDWLSDRLDLLGEILAKNAVAMGILFGVGIVLIAFVGTLIRTISRYYDLKLWRRPDGYRVNSGLLNRHEQVVAQNKVQMLQWNSNPIKKFFGIVAFRFYQASSNVMSSAKAITVPGCNYAQLDQIRNQYLGSIPLKPTYRFEISRKLFVRRWFFLGCLPSLLFFALFILSWYFIYFFVAVFWVIGAYWYQDRYHRTWQGFLNDRILQTSSGVVEITTRMLQHFKIQGLKIRQTPYQRRHQIATLHFYTASGPVVIPYISLEQAIHTKNYFNYQVESSRKPWM